MYYISKRNIIAVISIITILLMILNFILSIRTKSIDNEKTIVNNTDIDAIARIYSNTVGIPHICSASDKAIFFAMGYEHARQRLWQMWQWRTIAEGRLCEFYGEQFLKADIFMRTIDIKKIAYRLYDSCETETKTILQSYSDGINKFIKNNANRLPAEFAAIDCIPEEWKPQDCYIIQRFIAFLFSNNWYNDILLSAIANKIGTEKALALVPKQSEYSPYILTPTPTYLKDSVQYLSANSNNKITIANETSLQKLDNNKKHKSYLSKDFKDIKTEQAFVMSAIQQLQTLTGITTASIGSNTWAIHNQNDTNIILANDSHLPLILPNMWFQMHISSPSYNVLGFCIPGMPIFFAARNDNIAWGMANMMVDDVDYLIQKTDSSVTNYYINDTLTAKIKALEDSIKIVGKSPHKYYKIGTTEQNILTDNSVINIFSSDVYSSTFINGSTNKNSKQQHNKNANYLTFNWIGNLISDEISSMLTVMKSKNWNEFLNGVNGWQCPGIVFSFADVNGNIGIAPKAIIPIRANNFNPLLANPAWKMNNNSPDYKTTNEQTSNTTTTINTKRQTNPYNKGWIDYIMPKNIPVLYNPPKQFVCAANNNINNSNIYYGTYYAVDSRSKWIETLLLDKKQYTIINAFAQQNSNYSIYAKEVLSKLIPLINDNKNQLIKYEREALYKLMKWNYIIAQQTNATSIYNMFIAKLIYNIFKNEPKEVLQFYLFNQNTALTKLKEIVYQEQQIINNDTTNNDGINNDTINNATINNNNEIIIKSFKDACKTLANLYETNNTNNWWYEKQHYTNFNNNFNNYSKLLKYAHNLQLTPTNGGITTINYAEWQFNSPFIITCGVAMRFIADMKNDVAYMILAGGSSADVINSNYANQVLFWKIGEYFKLSINEIPTEDFKLAITINP